MKFTLEFEVTQIEQFKKREITNNVIEDELRSHVAQALKDHAPEMWIDTVDGGVGEFSVYKIEVI